MKTVGLVGAWNRNRGDMAILGGMRDVLGLDAFEGVDCQEGHGFVADAWTRYANDTYRALMVGAGGLIWDKPELDSPSGWQWQTTVEAIEALGVPLIVYGIGWTQFPYHDPTGEHPQFGPTLRAAFEKAELFAVRNDYRRRKLKETVGINPEVILDPAFFLKPAAESPILFKEPPIGVVWASDKPHMRWKNEAAREDAMRWLLTRLREDGGPVLLMQHIKGLDDEILNVLRTHLDQPVFSLEELAPEIYAEMNPRKLAAVYGEVRKVYSMRKHGVILANTAGSACPHHPRRCAGGVRGGEAGARSGHTGFQRAGTGGTGTVKANLTYRIIPNLIFLVLMVVIVAVVVAALSREIQRQKCLGRWLLADSPADSVLIVDELGCPKNWRH